MAYGQKSTTSSIIEVLTLNPLPYPVLLILAVIFIFLGFSWFSSYQEAVESAQEQMGLALLVTPVLILILAIWLSSFEYPLRYFQQSGYDRRRQTHYQASSSSEVGGGSPWAVGALIVFLLFVVHYQSALHESWFG